MWKNTDENFSERQRSYLQVVQLIRDRGRISRVEIASALHMTRGAVTLLVQEMLKQEILEEVGTAPAGDRKGRRKVMLDIHPARWFAIGVSVCANGISVGLTTLALKPLEKQFFPLSSIKDRDELETQIVTFVKQVLESNCLREHQIIGIGVGFMPTALEQFSVSELPDYSQHTTLEKELSKQLRIPVFAGSALPSITTNCLYEQPDMETTALFSADGDGYYLSSASRNNPISSLYRTPISMNAFHVTEDCTIQGALTPSAMANRLSGSYNHEKTPLLYHLTKGDAQNITLAALLTAATGGEHHKRDACLSSFVEDIMQQFCSVWSNILLVYQIDRLYLYGFDFTRWHLKKVKQYATRYLGRSFAERLSCSTCDEKSQYTGGIFYAVDGGLQVVSDQTAPHPAMEKLESISASSPYTTERDQIF